MKPLAVAAAKVAEDRYGPGSTAHHDAAVLRQGRKGCRINPGIGCCRRRTSSACLRLGLGLIACTGTADKHVRVHLEETGSREVLFGLHVVNAPDNQVARAMVDVEQVLAGLNLADAVDGLAVD